MYYFLQQDSQSSSLYVYNISMIALMKNLVFHRRSKHINTSFHFICECVEKKKIFVEFVYTREKRVDILIKDLAKVKFAEMRKFLGVKNLCELISLLSKKNHCELISLTQQNKLLT